jgi:hypothetical protein
LLLKYGADINRNPPIGASENMMGYRCIDWAIQNGSTEIISMVLEHGGFVAWCDGDMGIKTSLNILLCDESKSRENKVAISQMLVDHTEKDHDTLLFLQSSLEFAIGQQGHTDNDGDDDDDNDDDEHDEYDEDNIHILLEAGVVSTGRAFYIAINLSTVSTPWRKSISTASRR